MFAECWERSVCRVLGGEGDFAGVQLCCRVVAKFSKFLKNSVWGLNRLPTSARFRVLSVEIRTISAFQPLQNPNLPMPTHSQPFKSVQVPYLLLRSLFKLRNKPCLVLFSLFKLRNKPCLVLHSLFKLRNKPCLVPHSRIKTS